MINHLFLDLFRIITLFPSTFIMVNIICGSSVITINVSQARHKILFLFEMFCSLEPALVITTFDLRSSRPQVMQEVGCGDVNSILAT